jgi:hypothetical protein
MFDDTPLPWQGRHAKTSEEECAIIQKAFAFNRVDSGV